MIKQIQDTLNMFRTSRLDKTKTAYQETEGEFDWNATPLAPLGTREMVFTQTTATHMRRIATPATLTDARQTTIA